MHRTYANERTERSPSLGQLRICNGRIHRQCSCIDSIQYRLDPGRYSLTVFAYVQVYSAGLAGAVMVGRAAPSAERLIGVEGGREVCLGRLKWNFGCDLIPACSTRAGVPKSRGAGAEGGGGRLH